MNEILNTKWLKYKNNRSHLDIYREQLEHIENSVDDLFYKKDTILAEMDHNKKLTDPDYEHNFNQPKYINYFNDKFQEIDNKIEEKLAEQLEVIRLISLLLGA